MTIAEGIRSLIAVLYLDDFYLREFVVEKLELLSILTSFVTMSIDHARLHEKTMQLACKDGLTDLYNHRRFKKSFADELARSRRYRKMMSIILVDVDDFKIFNDTYGHPKGDIVLQEIANMLREQLMDCDTLFLYGGGEFVALLPESDLQEAVKIAVRIHSSSKRSHRASVLNLPGSGASRSAPGSRLFRLRVRMAIRCSRSSTISWAGPSA